MGLLLMSKIRWRTGERREFEKKLERYQYKIDYQIKKARKENNTDLVNSLKDLKKVTANLDDTIYSRKDKNFAEKLLKSYTPRKARELIDVKGEKHSRLEIEQILKLNDRGNKLKDKNKSKYLSQELIELGEKIGYNKAFLKTGNSEMLEYKHKEIDLEKQETGKSWDYMVEHVFKQAFDRHAHYKDKMVKDNYLKGLSKGLGHGYDEKVQQLIKKVQSTDLQKVVQIALYEVTADFEILGSDSLAEYTSGELQAWLTNIGTAFKMPKEFFNGLDGAEFIDMDKEME